MFITNYSDCRTHYQKTLFKVPLVRFIVTAQFFAFTFLPTNLFATTQSVAVMHFENTMKDSTLDWLSVGIPETITNDLLAIKGLALVERVQLRKVMDEQALQLTGAVDDKTAIKVGKLIGANVLVIGAFQKQGEVIRLTARFVDVQTGGVIQTAKATGKMDDIFDLQDQIVKELAKNLNIELKQQELANIAVKPTESLDAYQHFGQGALLQEKKDYQGAAKELKKATVIDPKFSLAKNKFAEIFLSLNKGNYWTYESETTQKLLSMNDQVHSMQTYNAKGQEIFNGVPVFSYIREVESESNNVKLKSTIYEYYVKKGDGIYTVGTKTDGTFMEGEFKGEHSKTETVYDPPYLIYPYDLEVGKKWNMTTMLKMKGSGISSMNSTAKWEEKFEVTGYESVTVPVGTFDCFVLKRESTMKGEGYSATIVTVTWFAQGVGIVKSRTESVLTGYKIVLEEALKDYHIEE
jgi:TolB-like protein